MRRASGAVGSANRISRSGGTLQRQVAAELGGRIVRGEIREGAALPNEAALCEELGVSRTVVREAVKVLAAKALLEVRPKTGTRVRPRSDWHMLDPEILEWQFSDPSAHAHLRELLEVRQVIEPAAARLAAERAQSEDLDEIERACAGMREAVEQTEASIEPDLRFHIGILRATHNVFMGSFGALIQAALRSSLRLTNADRAAYLRSVGQHQGVLDAIRDGDAVQAEAAMQRLLASTTEDVGRAAGPRRAASRAPVAATTTKAARSRRKTRARR